MLRPAISLLPHIPLVASILLWATEAIKVPLHRHRVLPEEVYVPWTLIFCLAVVVKLLELDRGRQMWIWKGIVLATVLETSLELSFAAAPDSASRGLIDTAQSPAFLATFWSLMILAAAIEYIDYRRPAIEGRIKHLLAVKQTVPLHDELPPARKSGKPVNRAKPPTHRKFPR